MNKPTYEEIINHAKMNSDCGEHMSPAEIKELVLACEAQVKRLAAENAAMKLWASQSVELWDAGCDMDGHMRDVPRTASTDAILASLRAEGVVDDYFGALVAKARASAEKAMRKFPQPNYVLLKVAEEAGEVVQAGVHYAENRMAWEQVEGEIIQLLAMLIRLVTEGDQINGITPPDSAQLRSKSEVQS